MKNRMHKTERGKKRKGLKALLMTLMFVLGMGRSSLAVEFVDHLPDPSVESSLDIYYHEGSTLLKDAKFKIYQVADLTPQGLFILSGDFASYPVTVNYLDAAGWKSACTVLEGYIQRDRIAPTFTGKTDAGGHLKISGIKTGLYLIRGESVEVDTSTLWPMSYLVSVPEADLKENIWIYDVVTEPKKYSRDEPGPDPDPKGDDIDITVIKAWEDAGAEHRPESITVTLLCDGTEIDTAVLTAADGWRHTFKSLDKGHEYRVVEDVPEGYHVSIDNEGGTVIITNTGIGGDDPNPPSNIAMLPQTGIDYEVAKTLLGASAVLFIAGCALTRDHRSKNDEE